MAEEGSIYRAKQRQSLLIADNIYLNLSSNKSDYYIGYRSQLFALSHCI